jgi:hypothetical protein
MATTMCFHLSDILDMAKLEAGNEAWPSEVGEEDKQTQHRFV